MILSLLKAQRANTYFSYLFHILKTDSEVADTGLVGGELVSNGIELPLGAMSVWRDVGCAMVRAPQCE